MKAKDRAGIALLLGALLLLTHGCSTTSIRESKLIELKNRPQITAVHYSPPLFMLAIPETSVRSSVGFAFGSFGSGMGVGVAVGGDKGSRPAPELAAQFSLQDPAIRVKDAFIARLREEFGFSNIRPEAKASAEDELAAVRKKYGQVAVIDFKTTHWALASYSTKNRYYYTPVKVRARIIGAGGAGVIWTGTCSYQKKKDEGSPTFEEATARSGALLKRMLSDAADYCAQELFGKLKDFK